MSSLISGYEYDIFISYRRKDNKGDRWVSEFVEALKTELESTFKEEISVYFDINPHDGLLETHDVDASLKDKLKCLIFIPIVSRTYCDPKSFAWEHEFKAFIEYVSNDQFGLKVKLPNGNVASRVLPIRIHDLDIEDIKLCESILGGTLRGVEFIYQEPGVNKPLTSEDDEKKNLNNTKYRIQINKVANAIKEIISGLKVESVVTAKEGIKNRELLEETKKEEKIEAQEKPARLTKKNLFPAALITAIILLIIAILTYPKIFKRDTLESLRSSGQRIVVAVIPFQNMTNDTTLNVWQNAIQEILTTSLSSTEEIRIRQTESVNALIQSKNITNYASITPSFASKIPQKLNTNVFIYGNIIKAGSVLRINAQLVDSKTEEVFKAYQIDGSSEEKHMFTLIDSLSTVIKNTLRISKLEKSISHDFLNYAFTNSPEAYRNFIYGKNAFLEGNLPAAVNLLSQAVAIDSNFIGAMDLLAFAYGNQGIYTRAKNIVLKFYKKREQVSSYMKAILNHTYAFFFGTGKEDIICTKQILEIDDQVPFFHYVSGNAYANMLQYDKAIPEYEKSLEIYKKWGSKPSWFANYTNLGYAYHKTGQYKKEKRLYKKAEQDFPDNEWITLRQAVLALTLKDGNAAEKNIKKFSSILKENSTSEADIEDYLADIYSESDNPDKSEEYLRKALSLDPDNPYRLNRLAYFLIYMDRKINEGLELVDKALEATPDDYNYLLTKGWGLYKQGKYEEALEVLQKSWYLRMQNAIYDHQAFLQLEEAKKAISSQMKN